MNDLSQYISLKKEKTKLDNWFEILYQRSKYYILEYQLGKRDSGKLSKGMEFQEACDSFDDIIEEENQLGARLDSILPTKL